MAKRIDYGLYIHAAVGLALGLLCWWIDKGLYFFLPIISVAGFVREILQAGTIGNMTWHKFREGLAWSTCWLVVLV